MVVCLLTMKVMLPLLLRTTGGLMTLQDPNMPDQSIY